MPRAAQITDEKSHNSSLLSDCAAISHTYFCKDVLAFLSENPDAFLKEIAEHFSGSITGAFNALKREKITYKKKNVSMRNEMNPNEPIMTQN
jgi:hypothetical protein